MAPPSSTPHLHRASHVNNLLHAAESTLELPASIQATEVSPLCTITALVTEHWTHSSCTPQHDQQPLHAPYTLSS